MCTVVSVERCAAPAAEKQLYKSLAPPGVKVTETVEVLQPHCRPQCLGLGALILGQQDSWTVTKYLGSPRATNKNHNLQ